jgi:prepilin-type N-terminal cleavage/methylation domain-containing protein
MNLLFKQKNKGFTLIELMVSVSIFSLVMVISMGSIVTVLDANRKSQNLRAVMDNLNSSLEGMTRTMRFGTNYHCGTTGTLSQPLDCPGGSNSLTVLSFSGVQTTYSLSGGRIIRNDTSGNYYVTSPNIIVQNLTFWVFGSSPYPGNLLQPRVIVLITGYSGSDLDTRSSFSLQTTISQRKIDFI